MRSGHLDVPKDVVPLRGEVVLHEGLLAATVPQVQDEVSQQSEGRKMGEEGRRRRVGGGE